MRVPVTWGPATLVLLDAVGRVARTALSPAGVAYPLDLTGLAPGIYALRVQTGEAQAVERLVVE
ncbi:T9SS type A sorting domain-containing protein [Hymenobacter antarcticus]|uniref:Por secretion system C-terminal sorting domain-containing protein n=1 Tax=Hymenobacter antarcticus TaxID=486270 RepID=A0ABP7QMB2_9BACT